MEPESKTVKTVEVSAPQRASKWSKVRRALKYLTLGFLGAVILLTIVTWMRSYSYSDRVQGTLGGDWCFMGSSSQGCVACVAFDSDGRILKEFEIDWSLKTYPIEHPMAYPSGEVIHATGKLRIGLIRQVHYALWSDQWITRTSGNRRGLVRFKGLTLFLKGGGLLVPHWLILLVSGTLFALIVMGRRFTLRAFMIWLTLVCVILGITMRIDLPLVQPNWKMYQDE